MRQDPLYITGDPGRAKMPQHGHPLIALLDIEIAQIFKAGNRLPDTLIF